MLNAYLYYVAGYVAFLTVVGIWRVTDWLIWGNMLLGWIPTTAQFIVNQVYIRRIVLSAKWRYLARLQKAIQELQRTDWIQASDTSIARINQLMDLHERVHARRDTSLNWNAWFNFLSQLLLPLAGLLVGNLDIFRTWLGRCRKLIGIQSASGTASWPQPPLSRSRNAFNRNSSLRAVRPKWRFSCAPKRKGTCIARSSLIFRPRQWRWQWPSAHGHV